MSNYKWTLKTLAQELGVSIATMSNAYNRPDQLSAQLRERLLLQAAALGYSGPSAAASSLRTGRTGVIGVMISHPLSYSFNDPVAGAFLEGISCELEKHGMSMLLLSSRLEQEALAGHVSLVDGFIIYGPPLPSIAAFMRRQAKPIVTVDFEMDDVPAVTLDDFGGCYRVARDTVKADDRVAVVGLRLVESGSVVNIQGWERYDSHYITTKRLQGFLQGALEKGVVIGEASIWCAPENTYSYAREVAECVLSQPHRPSLVLCMSDRLALAMLDLAREKGLRVPEDIRVSGFDDIPEASRAQPALTTVAQQCQLKGETAAQMFTGERERASTQLATEVQYRASSPAQ